MSNAITLCPPLRITPCTTSVAPEVSATSTAPSSLVFSNYCEAGAYSHTRLCKVYHSLQISDLKKIVLTDLRFLLSDPQAVIVQKQDRLEAFRRADLRLNAFFGCCRNDHKHRRNHPYRYLAGTDSRFAGNCLCYR